MNREITFSTHAQAQAQAQRRGIDSSVVNYAVEFGKRVYAGGGSIRCYFDKKARYRLQKELPCNLFAKIEKQLNCFVILAEENEVVITVGHQYKKVMIR